MPASAPGTRPPTPALLPPDPTARVGLRAAGRTPRRCPPLPTVSSFPQPRGSGLSAVPRQLSATAPLPRRRRSPGVCRGVRTADRRPKMILPRRPRPFFRKPCGAWLSRTMLCCRSRRGRGAGGARSRGAAMGGGRGSHWGTRPPTWWAAPVSRGSPPHGSGGPRVESKGSRDVGCVPWALPRLVQALDDLASARRRYIAAEDTVGDRDTSPSMGTSPPPISPTSAMGWWGRGTAGW